LAHVPEVWRVYGTPEVDAKTASCRRDSLAPCRVYLVETGEMSSGEYSAAVQRRAIDELFAVGRPMVTRSVTSNR
jgi:hypothetical protein